MGQDPAGFSYAGGVNSNGSRVSPGRSEHGGEPLNHWRAEAPLVSTATHLVSSTGVLEDLPGLDG